MDCHHIPQVPYSEFSERIHSKVVETRIPINGTIEITFRCNLRCVHCYCSYESTKEEISYREICRILDEVADAGCLWLLITGGEPLLRNDFLDIYTYAKKKGLIITLFTNGTLITPYIADFLKDYPPFALEISLYGVTKEIYEKVTGVSGSFKRCIEGIHLLLKRDLPVKLKTMVMTLNRHEVWEIKKYAESLGVEFRFDPLLNPRLDGSQGPCKLRISPQEVLELDLADEKRAKGWEEFCEKFPHPMTSDLLYTCSAGRTSFHIDPYGNLNICIISRSSSYNLCQGSFKKGWYNFIPKILSRRQTNRYECSRCDLRDLCNQCPGWSQLEMANPEMPVEYLCQVAHLRAQAFGFGRYKENKREEVIFNGEKIKETLF
jgi:radical SAM protein with 4Fe4S-binding SPASM domain